MRLKRHHWGILIATLLVLGGLAGYTLVRNGFFPLARVSGKFIALKTVEENMAVAQRLYDQGLLGARDEALASVFEGERSQLFEKTLESLIVNTVVRSRSSKEIRARAETRIDAQLAGTDTSLGANIEAFYGWDPERFRERILEPRALEEVLREDLSNEGYEVWLRSALADANVQVWFVPFEWRDGALQRK